ncbi:MAG: homocitrate synthase, partial [Clostridiales bacterium]|nr:homocitrate synthase [Clostridiales bacterium]
YVPCPELARCISGLGVYQIEAGIPAMGGDEKKSVQKIAELGLKSKISSWNRLNIDDIRQSADCGVQLVHISIPVSDIQINKKLGTSRRWVIENMKKCMDYCQSRDLPFSIGLEDASRADMQFIKAVIAESVTAGAVAVRYADTVGIMTRKRILNEIPEICAVGGNYLDIEMHAHNDLGMAVSNSIAAVEAGAGLVDCTLGGIGERAGNCGLYKFVLAARANLGECFDIDPDEVIEAQNELYKMIS